MSCFAVLRCSPKCTCSLLLEAVHLSLDGLVSRLLCTVLSAKPRRVERYKPVILSYFFILFCVSGVSSGDPQTEYGLVR